MKRVTSVKVFIILGVLFYLSSAGSIASGHDTNYSSTGGLIFLLGALAVYSRNKQKVASSKLWQILEIISLAIILIMLLLGFLSGNWINHPINLTLIPIIILVTWFISFRNKKDTIFRDFINHSKRLSKRLLLGILLLSFLLNSASFLIKVGRGSGEGSIGDAGSPIHYYFWEQTGDKIVHYSGIAGSPVYESGFRFHIEYYLLNWLIYFVGIYLFTIAVKLISKGIRETGV